ncbi:PREDICTED: putative disease resistance [Prunus dulcis]|uniref:PREDICTED: putative disease resistance n=1 Tax=Prunus dulcis TaxID=3755 RepID=A0A5E4GDL3_PRUDU|nr:PREDICTED: putative disease resistance [Prunus dulcis]
MPVKIGRLKRLRTLTTFVVGKSTGSSIRELTELTNLQGKLCILNLQNVFDAMVAFRANLKERKDLKELELEWGDKDAHDSTKERDFICLSGCSYPSSLPPLGQLPVLQELTIKSMKSVTTKLKFDEMLEWEEWLPSPGGGNSLDFARLEKLILRKCSKLRGNLHNHLRSMKKLSCPVVRFCTKG